MIVWTRVVLKRTCSTKKETGSIVTSDNQIVHNYIVSLAIVSHAVLDANSAVSFVHFLQKDERLIRPAIDMS